MRLAALASQIILFIRILTPPLAPDAAGCPRVSDYTINPYPYPSPCAADAAGCPRVADQRCGLKIEYVHHSLIPTGYTRNWYPYPPPPLCPRCGWLPSRRRSALRTRSSLCRPHCRCAQPTENEPLADTTTTQACYSYIYTHTHTPICIYIYTYIYIDIDIDIDV